MFQSMSTNSYRETGRMLASRLALGIAVPCFTYTLTIQYFKNNGSDKYWSMHCLVPGFQHRPLSSDWSRVWFSKPANDSVHSCGNNSIMLHAHSCYTTNKLQQHSWLSECTTSITLRVERVHVNPNVLAQTWVGGSKWPPIVTRHILNNPCWFSRFG